MSIHLKVSNRVWKKKLMKEMRGKGTASLKRIEVSASFEQFSTSDMDDLIRTVSQISTLEGFSIKLPEDIMYSPASLSSQSLQTLLQFRLLKSLVLINCQLALGQTLRLRSFVDDPPRQDWCLESLRLTNCHPTTRDVPEYCLTNLISGLSRIPTLKSIECTNVTFASEDLATQLFMDMIATNHIETIKIKNCSNVLPTMLVRPMEELKRNTTLKILTLVTYTPMTDQGLQWMGEMLGENQALEELHVDCYNIDADFCSLLPISTGLGSNQSLQTFQTLPSERGDDRTDGTRHDRYIPPPDVVEAFSSLLETNRSLQQLGFPGHPWDRNVYNRLRRNQICAPFFVNPEGTSYLNWINTIIRYHNETAIIYEAILKNPSAITCHLSLANDVKDDNASNGEESSCEESSDDEDSVGSLPKRRHLRAKDHDDDDDEEEENSSGTSDGASSEGNSSDDEESVAPVRKKRRAF